MTVALPWKQSLFNGLFSCTSPQTARGAKRWGGLLINPKWIWPRWKYVILYLMILISIYFRLPSFLISFLIPSQAGGKYLIATIGHFVCLSSNIPHQIKLWLVPLFDVSHHTFTLISYYLLILDFYHSKLECCSVLRTSSQRFQCGWRLLSLNTGWCSVCYVYQSNPRLLHFKHL